MLPPPPDELNNIPRLIHYVAQTAQKKKEAVLAIVERYQNTRRTTACHAWGLLGKESNVVNPVSKLSRSQGSAEQTSPIHRAHILQPTAPKRSAAIHTFNAQQKAPQICAFFYNIQSQSVLLSYKFDKNDSLIFAAVLRHSQKSCDHQIAQVHNRTSYA